MRSLPAIVGLLPLHLAFLQQFLHGVIATPVASGQQRVIGPDTATEDVVVGQEGSRRLNGKFLHITDFHPDQFYKTHSSTEEGIACHRGDGPAGYYGAETSDCDTPSSLVNATFDWIAANIADDIDFVIWTGDSARHDSDENIPRNPAQVLGTNRWIADKFAEAFGDPKDPTRMAVPVIPTFGNNDILPHNILLPGPNKWLGYYAEIWKRFIPEEQRHSFEYGGWFYVEVIPKKLAVFSLNTLYFFDRNAGVDDCQQPFEPGFKQMEWLRVQLEFLRERGMKAILMGHVPPARTDSKKNWDETCWQKYNLWMQQYRDVVVGSLYGHMNIDHFIVHDTKEVNINILGGYAVDDDVGREAFEDELEIQSAQDYLTELREGWAKLPPVDVKALEEEDTFQSDAQGKKGRKGDKDKKKKKPGKDLGGKYAERYHLSLVGPSIVPNYFPTLRVVEYNISGLENAAVWTDSFTNEIPSLALPTDADPVHEELKREIDAAQKRKGKKGKKGKKPTTPKDPNLVIPQPPPAGTGPGPAYAPQPLTFLGYTQYFANLTYLNNDMTQENKDVSRNKWRDGIHKDKDPKSKKPKPRPFAFEVEYSTFTDKIYKLSDLTVRSYVKLANRIARENVKGKALAQEDDEEEDDDDDDDDEEEEYQKDEMGQEEENDSGAVDEGDEGDKEDEDTEDDGVETEKNSGKKGKKGRKGKKKKKKHNKVWLHFLKHAFVRTVPQKKLKKF
ncbi:Putative calcineurin-like phosphoesterase domain, ApaH type, metallo-dependent phosphatase [Colletotrichum destructivum]|uniref:Endopolyphosphatase n=1 Tax=Colletotrichum destructivum TaxID=34406 RepID=A0AAX4INJ8_9PEZI|nr:Putative calcineurin-like phosphoesterase domain, ApaH type, metallo-dependent phosphatase [Colletotrichum destructivum]